MNDIYAYLYLDKALHLLVFLELFSCLYWINPLFKIFLTLVQIFCWMVFSLLLMKVLRPFWTFQRNKSN